MFCTDIVTVMKENCNSIKKKHMVQQWSNTKWLYAFLTLSYAPVVLMVVILTSPHTAGGISQDTSDGSSQSGH